MLRGGVIAVAIAVELRPRTKLWGRPLPPKSSRVREQGSPPAAAQNGGVCPSSCACLIPRRSGAQALGTQRWENPFRPCPSPWAQGGVVPCRGALQAGRLCQTAAPTSVPVPAPEGAQPGVLAQGHVKGVLASLPVCRGQRKGLSQWNSRADGLCVMSRWNSLPSAAQTPSRSPLCLWQGGEVPARPGRRGKEPQFAPAHVTFVLCWSLLSLCWRWPTADWG